MESQPMLPDDLHARNAPIGETADGTSEGISHDSLNLLRHTALQTSTAILTLQRRAEEELLEAKQALEERTKELANSVSLLNATLESTADGIVALDLAGKIISCNTKFAAIWHFPDELLERRDGHAMMAYAAARVKDSASFLQRVSARQADPEMEAFDVVEMQDGRTFERYQFPQRVNGECVGVVVNFRDITERKRVEIDLARFAAIVDSSHDAIISKTLDGVITSWNQGAERLFGYRAEEVIGKPILILIPPDHHDEEPAILARLRQGERIEHYETVRVKKNGELIHISLSVSPIRSADGSIVGASKIARDITERKAAEAEREHLLLREQAARAQAEAANRAKDEFLAIVSHELRTPLNPMIGWAQILLTQEVDEATNKQALESVLRNAKVQARLIDDLLDVSRIVSGKMTLSIQPVEPMGLILEALSIVRPEADKKGITLRTVMDANIGTLPGDPHRLQQSIWNLLSNSIKFTPAGGVVEIHLERAESHVQIQVRDTGTGISPGFLPYVFDRLRQADSSSTRREGGLGLGLSIVRHVVELHGGTVQAESAGEGQGATFTIRLPLRMVPSSSTAPISSNGEQREAGPAPGETPAAQIADALRGIKVLLVEDEVDARDMIATLLKQHGADVTASASAVEALAALERFRPDVIVSDIAMPGEDGYTMMRQIRSRTAEQGGQTPAIALTAYAGEDARRQSLAAGYQVHLPKPIDATALVATIGQWSTEEPEPK